MYLKKPFSAVVPVAGSGTRLRPHTHTYPKVLLTVGHKPILGHILDQLIEIGKPKVYLIIGHFGDKIKEYVLKAYPSLEVVFIEQNEPKGLGHAVSLTAEHIKGPLFILLGDTIISADMRQFVKFKEDCVAVMQVEDPRRFGVVEEKNGYVSRITEKPERPATNTAIVGAYSFRDSGVLYACVRELIQSGKTTKGEIQLTDALQLMIKHGSKIRTVQIKGWHDCGKPETLLATNRYILDMHKNIYHRKGNLIIPPVYLSKSSKISDSILGPHVSIGDGAEISFSIARNCIINEKAKVNNMNLCGSIIGPSAVLIGRKDQINIGESSEINFGERCDKKTSD